MHTRAVHDMPARLPPLLCHACSPLATLSLKLTSKKSEHQAHWLAGRRPIGRCARGLLAPGHLANAVRVLLWILLASLLTLCDHSPIFALATRSGAALQAAKRLLGLWRCEQAEANASCCHCCCHRCHRRCWAPLLLPPVPPLLPAQLQFTERTGQRHALGCFGPQHACFSLLTVCFV